MNQEIPDGISLREVVLFKDLNGQVLAQLRLCLREKNFEKDNIIFSAGDSCRHILIVQSGRVKVFLTSLSGKEQILQILGPGDSCVCNPGELCWYCSASVQAITEARVWLLLKEDYVRLVKTNLKLTQRLNEIFAKRLCWFNSLIEEISLDKSEKRLVKFILERGNSISEDASSGITFTHEEISRWIGVTRETVTRHLNKLKRLRLIDIKPYQILILDRSRLERMVSTLE